MFVDSGRAVVGTPDDAIAMIERLRGKQGKFGVFLAQHVDWGDWEQTKKSYELYARYVMPHFRRADTNRRASFERLEARKEEMTAIRKAASEQSIAKGSQVTI